MLARLIFLFMLIISIFFGGALLLKNRYQKTLIPVWCIVAFVVGSIISVSIQTYPIFCDQYNISVIDKNSLASNNKIYLEKDNEIRDNQIVDGFWLDDGEFLIYSSDAEGITNDIDINIPVGIERDISFEKNSFCGIVEVKSIDQNFDFIFDLYSEESDSLSIPLPNSSIDRLIIDGLLKVALFCLCLAIAEILLYWLLFKKISNMKPISNRTKYFLILMLGFFWLFFRYYGPPSSETSANYQNVFYFENYELGFLSRGLIGHILCEISPYWTETQLYLIKICLAIVLFSIVCISVSKILVERFDDEMALFIALFILVQPLTSVLFTDYFRNDICYIILYLVSVLVITKIKGLLPYLPLVCILIILINETTCLTIIPSIIALLIYYYVNAKDNKYIGYIVASLVVSLGTVFITTKYGKGGTSELEVVASNLSSHFGGELKTSSALRAEYFLLSDHIKNISEDYLTYWQEFTLFFVLLIPVFYVIACLFKSLYFKSNRNASNAWKRAFALVVICAFSPISAMIIAGDYGRYMVLIFIMLMSSFFVMVEHEKATFHLDDIYLFKKNENSNVWPFIILVVCSWIGPYSDTATKTLRYVSLWKEYFEELFIGF